MRDKRTGVEYQWPSPDQVEAALKLGSNILPKVGRVQSTSGPVLTKWRQHSNWAPTFFLRLVGYRVPVAQS